MTWCERCDPKIMEGQRDYVMSLLRWIVPESILFAKKHCMQLLQPGETKLLMQTLSIVEMLLLDACDENPEDYSKYLFGWYQYALMLAVVWGVGGILDSVSRVKFDEFYREVRG